MKNAMDDTGPEIKETEVEEIKEMEPVCTEPRLIFVPPKLEKHGDIGTISTLRGS